MEIKIKINNNTCEDWIRILSSFVIGLDADVDADADDVLLLPEVFGPCPVPVVEPVEELLLLLLLLLLGDILLFLFPTKRFLKKV